MSVLRSISSGRKTSLITYTDTDPKKAQQVANTLGQVASEHVPNEITATVWRKARLPLTPASPNPLRNGLIALVASLALAISTHSLFTLGALAVGDEYTRLPAYLNVPAAWRLLKLFLSESYSPFKVGSLEDDSFQYGSSEVGSSEYGSFEAGSSEVGSFEIA